MDAIVSTDGGGRSTVEAQKIEAVEDFVMQSGLVQWNTVRVTTAMTTEETVRSLEKVPPPLY